MYLNKRAVHFLCGIAVSGGDCFLAISLLALSLESF